MRSSCRLVCSPHIRLIPAAIALLADALAAGAPGPGSGGTALAAVSGPVIAASAADAGRGRTLHVSPEGGDTSPACPVRTSGQNSLLVRVYATSAPLPAVKTVTQVILSDVSSGVISGGPSLHIFAIKIS